MYFQKHGLVHGPILFCIPGLIGGPEDFNEMIGKLGEKFSIIIIDPNDRRRLEEGMNLSLESMKEISYDSTSIDVKNFLLENYPDRKYFFLGVSLGGKVVYDFAVKFPEHFSGGVITDVGPGPFSESELFITINDIVNNVDLNLPWPELKKKLQESIPDKNLRVLIQTQVAYPNQAPPAIWKTGMKNFENLLKRQSLDNQEELLMKVDSTLFESNHYLNVLHSGKMSGIGERVYQEMKKMKSLKIQEVADGNHFLHISHKDLIITKVLSMLTSQIQTSKKSHEKE